MGAFSVLSLIALMLIAYGYWAAPQTDIIFAAGSFARPITIISMLVACVMIAAAYVPDNHIKSHVRHPMIIGVAIAAGSHLLTPIDAKQLYLFGGFFLFGIIDTGQAFRRDFKPVQPACFKNDVIAIVSGVAVFCAIAFYLHAVVLGVAIW